MTPEQAATPRLRRVRLARAELWMALADQVDHWGTTTAGPVAEIMARYGLDRHDLDRLCLTIGNQCETRAKRSGYDEVWR